MEAPASGRSLAASELISQAVYSLLHSQTPPGSSDPQDHLKSSQTSTTVVLCETLLQVLILGALILFHRIHQKIRDRRARNRDRERHIVYDIERQTSRPVVKDRKHFARIVQALKDRYTEIPTSYTLTEAELADPDACRPAIKPSKKRVRWKLDLVHHINDTTPLLPCVKQDIKRKKPTLLSVIRRVVFWTALHTRCSTRRSIKKIRQYGRKLHAWTMCQPERIPFIGTDAPSNGVSLAIGSMILINLITLLIGMPWDKDFMKALAKRAAMLKAANTPILYVLSMKTQPLQFLAGCSYEHVNIFHRRLGELSLFLAALHSIGHILPVVVGFWNGMSLNTTHSTALGTDEGLVYFSQYSSNTQLQTVTGCALLLCCIAIFATSTTKFRRRSYQLFLLIHSPLQTLFLGFAWLHSAFARPFIVMAITIYILDRFIFRYFLRLKGLVARILVLRDDQVIQLDIDRFSQRLNIWDRLKSVTAKYLAAPWAPGCHVLLTVRSLESPYNTESHPLYLLSAKDNTDEFFRRDNVQLVVKAYGDWSTNLVNACQSLSTLNGVEIEGPYGSGHPQALLKDRDICILVASSCGMTPMLPIAQSLVDWDHGYDPLTNDIKPRKQDILLILVHREYQNAQWFETQLYRLEGTGIDCIAIGPSEIYWNPAPQLRNTINWFIETRDPQMNKRIGLLCSGPREMQRTVRGVASKAREEGCQCVVDCLSFKT